MTKFECDKCGICCREVPASIIIKFGLPLHSRGRGCAHQSSDGSCSIYSERPDICQVKPDADGGFSINERACKILQEEFGRSL